MLGYRFTAGQVPATVKRLVNCQLEIRVLQHAQLGRFFSRLFGAVTDFAPFVARKRERRVFDWFVSSGHLV